MTKISEKSFADYWDGAENWITLASGEYYPDILEDACNLYLPVKVVTLRMVPERITGEWLGVEQVEK